MADSLQTRPSPASDPHAGSGDGQNRRQSRSVLFLLDRFLPAGAWGVFAAANAIGLLRAWPGLPTLERCQRCTVLVFVVLMTLLFLVRRPRQGPQSQWWEQAVALAGTFCMSILPAAFWLRPHTAPPWLTLTSIVVSWAGMIWAVLSLAYLGRCFGLFPEPRGLVTKGPYRWIRHPLYLGEIVGAAGVVLGTCHWAGAFPLAVFIALQTWRAFNEERALSAQFPDYNSYAHRTWRMLPWI